MRIDDKKPGPELDDLAEEIIFRRNIKEFDDIYTNRWRFKRRDDEKHPNHWHPSLSYSTSWEGMRLVVEEMQRQFGGCEINCCSAKNGDTWYIVTLYAGSRQIKATERTAPHAVTKAAIKALQGEDTQP